MVDPYSAKGYSLAGTVKALDGIVPPEVLSPSQGNVDLQSSSELGDLIENITKAESASIVSETISSLLSQSIAQSANLGEILDQFDTSTDFARSETLSKQLYQVARVIKARKALEAERDVFYVELGGFDTHASLQETVASKMEIVNSALDEFVTEMKAQGTWNNVTIVSGSEFGRTLDNNGFGTDHGWGGNTFVLGGSLNGSHVLGQYPWDLAEEVNVGRGRLIPTTSWEALWHSVCQWFGVEDDDMGNVLPNKHNFGNRDLFTKHDVFISPDDE